MKIKELVSKVAKQEGKKHQASVGDVREVVAIISDLTYRFPELSAVLRINGSKRASRRRKARE